MAKASFIASDLNKTLTPVKFPEQKTKSAETIEIKNRLEKILDIIVANHNKWELAQKRGASLCSTIESIKTKGLESGKNSNEAKPPKYYPDELKIHSDKLAIILRILNDIYLSTQQSITQLNALRKLNRNPKKIFYRTWILENFCKFVEKVESAYKNEIEIKKIITSEISHSTNRPDLIMHSSIWQYPLFANDDLNTSFIFLRLEIKPN